MATVEEIELAIRTLSPTDRNRLARSLPTLLPELDGDILWKSITDDSTPRTALSATLDGSTQSSPVIQKSSVPSVPAISNRRGNLARDRRILAALSRASVGNPAGRTRAYGRFEENPAHSGLRVERLTADPRAWSVRVTRDFRAVARRYDDDTWLWFWIGSHREFDRRFPR